MRYSQSEKMQIIGLSGEAAVISKGGEPGGGYPFSGGQESLLYSE